MKGLLITFEGCEGSGKTTQIDMLVPWLKEYTNNKISIIKTKEPGQTLLGNKIRELLLNIDNKINPLSELFLYYADRSQHIKEVIKPNLDKNNIIICDRFIDSTIAYQGYGREINLNLINILNQSIISSIQIDLTFILDIDIKGLNRIIGSKDRIELEDLEFHNKVRNGYLTIASNNKRYIIIDANKPKDEIFSEIKQHIRNKLKKHKLV